MVTLKINTHGSEIVSYSFSKRVRLASEMLAFTRASNTEQETDGEFQHLASRITDFLDTYNCHHYLHVEYFIGIDDVIVCVKGGIYKNADVAVKDADIITDEVLGTCLKAISEHYHFEYQVQLSQDSPTKFKSYSVFENRY
jgi:hypothetical protein